MEADDDLREFAHLWDGSENWGLIANYWESELLTVVFAGESPTVGELDALRRLCEEFRAMPAHELKVSLKGKGEVELGRFSGMEAHEFRDRATQLNVPFSIRSYATEGIFYSLVRLDEGRDGNMIIEDEDLHDRVVREMLKRGVPIVAVSTE